MGSLVPSERELEEQWFQHECILKSGAAESPYGMTASEDQPFKGFVSQSTRTVMSPQGEARVTETVVHCPLRIVVSIGDHVTLPEPFGGEWVVAENAAFEGAGQDTPNHQTLSLQTAAITNTNPYENEGSGPYG